MWWLWWSLPYLWPHIQTPFSWLQSALAYYLNDYLGFSPFSYLLCIIQSPFLYFCVACKQIQRASWTLCLTFKSLIKLVNIGGKDRSLRYSTNYSSLYTVLPSNYCAHLLLIRGVWLSLHLVVLIYTVVCVTPSQTLFYSLNYIQSIHSFFVCNIPEIVINTHALSSLNNCLFDVILFFKCFNLLFPNFPF